MAGVADGRGGDDAERAGEAETVRAWFETFPLVLLSNGPRADRCLDVHRRTYGTTATVVLRVSTPARF